MKKAAILKGAWYKMTTEEMLLQLVEGQKQTNERLDKMDVQFDKINVRLDKMDLRLDKIDGRLDNMENDIKSIKLELENRVSTLLKSLCEMQLENSKRLRALENDMQEFKDQLAIGEVLHGLKESDLL